MVFRVLFLLSGVVFTCVAFRSLVNAVAVFFLGTVLMSVLIGDEPEDLLGSLLGRCCGLWVRGEDLLHLQQQLSVFDHLLFLQDAGVADQSQDAVHYLLKGRGLRLVCVLFCITSEVMPLDGLEVVCQAWFLFTEGPLNALVLDDVEQSGAEWMYF